MSERVVVDMFLEIGKFCSDFKKRKEISIKYGLHVERAVNCLVKERLFPY